jgi:hypothetical protein
MSRSCNRGKQEENESEKRFNHTERSAAEPQPNLEKTFYRRGSGREKKFKNNENSKISLNEIKYLQVLIFAKTNFFSRFQSSQSSECFSITNSYLGVLRVSAVSSLPYQCHQTSHGEFAQGAKILSHSNKRHSRYGTKIMKGACEMFPPPVLSLSS